MTRLWLEAVSLSFSLRSTVDMSTCVSLSNATIKIAKIYNLETPPLLWLPSRMDLVTGMLVVAPNWVRLVPNGTNLGLFKISFSTFGAVRQMY